MPINIMTSEQLNKSKEAFCEVCPLRYLKLSGEVDCDIIEVEAIKYLGGRLVQPSFTTKIVCSREMKMKSMDIGMDGTISKVII